VIYPVSIIPERFQWLIYTNPMAGVITVARSSFLHTGPIDWRSLLIAFGISLAWLLFGVYYFRKTEKFFADII
jgi:lipopolysaccharide transport system permease protein